jgi:hypothetical protein
MTQHLNGISRHGLDAAFAAEESRKSNLLLQATLLREQGQEEAAIRFAEAADIEERLGATCVSRGLTEKSFVHRFSAASCWAQAGNLYRAIQLCQELLADTSVPARLRLRIERYLNTLRTRLNQWYAEAVAETANAEA